MDISVGNIQTPKMQDNSNHVRDLVLQVSDLSISYETAKGLVQAVRGVSFKVHQSETLGLVGESGCGKSTTVFGALKCLPRSGRILAGRINFLGSELRNASEIELSKLRGNEMALVPQDAMQALNPCLTIGEQLIDVVITHQDLERKSATDLCINMLDEVYMPDPTRVMDRYPHQLSGGQQQRVMIGMALLNSPALLVMDEPTTALDVTVEAAVLDLITELQEKFDSAIIYVTHDMGVIARIADTVGVMYGGEIVEYGSVKDIFLEPKHPYTQGLMQSVPRTGLTKEEAGLNPIPGRVVSTSDELPGCRFEPRCKFADARCKEEHPNLPATGQGFDHSARCFFADEVAQSWHLDDDASDVRGSSEILDMAKDGRILSLQSVRTYYERESRSIASIFGLGKRERIKAVDGVTFDVQKGSTFGIVGESGCGKSTLAKTIIGLERLDAGRIEFKGKDVSDPVSERSQEQIRALQMVFQNPDATLNPSYSVGYQIGRPLRRFGLTRGRETKAEVKRLLEAVRLSEDYYHRLPRHLSGGERQRIGIARALAGNPDLVLCDEPTSSLDVSVQAAVLNLLMEIQGEFGTTLLYISHDLSVVRYLCDYVAVMYLGSICELGTVGEIYNPPFHPYTQALLSAAPLPDPTIEQKRIRLGGTVPSALNPPRGCRFHTRCPRKAGDLCSRKRPEPRHFPGDHFIWCHATEEDLAFVEPIFGRTPGG